MKYEIEGFWQDALVKEGLNYRDAVILRWFLSVRDKFKTMMIDGDVYVLVIYHAVIEEFPIMDFSMKQVRTIFDNLVVKGFLKKAVRRGNGTGGSTLWFSLTGKHYDMEYSAENWRAVRQPDNEILAGSDQPVKKADVPSKSHQAACIPSGQRNTTPAEPLTCPESHVRCADVPSREHPDVPCRASRLNNEFTRIHEFTTAAEFTSSENSASAELVQALTAALAEAFGVNPVEIDAIRKLADIMLSLKFSREAAAAYISWFVRRAESRGVRNVPGYFFKAAEFYVREYLQEREQHAAQEKNRQKRLIVCPVCGKQHDKNDDVCPVCGLEYYRLNDQDEIIRRKKIIRMTPEEKTHYEKELEHIVLTYGRTFTKDGHDRYLQEMNKLYERYGLTAS